VSLPYRQILREAAAKVTAVSGTTASALQSAYLTSPLTTTQIGNTDFTLAMIQDALVNTVGRIVRAYASVPTHPYRAFNLSQTSALASGALIPSTNSASKPIVGVYGAIRSNSGDVMTEQPLQIIQTIIDNTDGFLQGTYNHFKIVDGRLIHTATTATIDVCTFSASDELTSIGVNGNAPIPDALLDVAVAGLLGWLARS